MYELFVGTNETVRIKRESVERAGVPLYYEYSERLDRARLETIPRSSLLSVLDVLWDMT